MLPPRPHPDTTDRPAPPRQPPGSGVAGTSPATNTEPAGSGAAPLLPARVAGEASHTALTSLSPSLLQDLQRFEAGGPQRELLEVLAAAIRHTQTLAIDLRQGDLLISLVVYPMTRQVQATTTQRPAQPMPLAQLLQTDLGTLQVRQVRPPGQAGHDSNQAETINPLLWAVALRGARGALLPELAGQAAYRVAPGLDLAGLAVPGAMALCIEHLRGRTCNLAAIAGWHSIGSARATRLLNALYLQSGLIVSRSHPAATNLGWAGYRQSGF